MNHYGWVIIGAGPAGIAAIGKLLDAGVPHTAISWIDPEFTIGELGKKWYRVNGNTKVKTFINFFNACKSFNYKNAPYFAVNQFDIEKSCRLINIVQPLKWITQQLKKQVNCINGRVCALSLQNQHWHIELEDSVLISKQVILATGSYPKSLSHPLPEISAEIALNDQLLENQNLKHDTVAVFGSSHSAIVVLENLMNTDVKKIINFYRHPLKYAIDMDDYILFDNTGLKGKAADWAKKHIDGACPDRIERVLCNSDSMQEKLMECTKVIYAIGFEPNSTITIHPFDYPLEYNDTNGIIAPGLFGFGIAYPNKVTDPLGNIEHAVGLWKFMQHINRCLPIWMRYHA